MDSDLPPLLPPVSPSASPAADGPPPPATEPPTSRLAVASLVLGLLPCGVTGAAGIVCGILAKKRISQSAGRLGGSGLATAGIVVSASFTVVAPFFAAILAGLLLPALAVSKAKAQRIQCANNLRQIGFACRMYSADHEGQFPAGYDQLAEVLASTKVLICPADSRPKPATNWVTLTSRNTSYPYFGAKLTNEEPQTVIACCTNRLHSNFLMGDGFVRQLDPRKQPAGLRREGDRMILEP